MEMPDGDIPAKEQRAEEHESDPIDSHDQGFPPDRDVREENRAALVITIQSWATPIAAALMLVVGLLAGYFGRPLLDQRFVASTDLPATVPEAQSTGDDQVPASQDALMAAVVAQTRHFKGAQDAPVTIVEFSDFQ